MDEASTPRVGERACTDLGGKDGRGCIEQARLSCRSVCIWQQRARTDPCAEAGPEAAAAMNPMMRLRGTKGGLSTGWG